MKVLHFSDTHLGITLENTPREQDFYNNFEKVINIILDLKPQVVIHSGDLFHTSKPSNKAISVVVKNFLKLEKSGINVIIIAGNHDTPRLSTTTHPFEIFKSFKNFYVFYEPKIYKLKIGNTNFVVLPHIHDENIFKEEFKKSIGLINDSNNNIFISHFGISAQEYDEYTDEISGVNISIDDLKILKKFDYVALGHFHKQFGFGNISYPGSIEKTNFNAKNHKIGYNIFDTDLQKKESFSISSRKMMDLGIINCKDFKTTRDLIEFLEIQIDKEEIKGAIVKILLENVTNILMLEFDEKLFLDFFSPCFYFQYKKIKILENKNISGTLLKSENLIVDNFKNFFDDYILDKTDRDFKKEDIFKHLEKKLKTI